MSFSDEMAGLKDEIWAAAIEQLWREYWLAIPNRNDPRPVTGVPGPGQYEHDHVTAFNQWFDSWLDVYGSGDIETFQVIVNGYHDLLAAEAIGERTPDYAAYAGVSDSIENARSDVDRVETNLATWLSPAATTFRNSFLANYDDAANHQLGLVQGLGRLVRAYQEMMFEGQNTIRDICDKTITALNGLDNTGGGGTALSFANTVVGIVQSVLRIGTVGGAAISLVQFGAGLLVEGEPPPATGHIQGGKVWEVLQSTDRALMNLTEAILFEEAQIQAAVDAYHGSLDQHLNKYLALDNSLASNIDGFTKESSNVVVEAAMLYYTGKIDLPAAAYNYNHAIGRIGTCAANDSTAFGTWFTATRFSYAGLRDRFSAEVLQTTSDNLVSYGNCLCEAAVLYAETDGHTADEVSDAYEGLVADLGPTGEGIPPVVHS